MPKARKVVLEIYRGEQFWCARGIGESIFTQGQTLDKLVENIKEAVTLHFEEELAQGQKIEIQIKGELEVAAEAATS